MSKFVAALMFLCASQSYADHFNTNNLLNECSRDTSFESSCYTYVAAYSDLLGFFIFSAAEERNKIFCLSRVPTPEIVKALGKMTIRSTDPHRIGDFLIKEFCK